MRLRTCHSVAHDLVRDVLATVPARLTNPPAARSRKLHDRIAAVLGADIAGGVIPEGTGLPSEFEAADRLGVSRTAYREAIRALTSKGLVSSRTKIGSRVNRRADWALLDPDVLAWVFCAIPSRNAIAHLFELRSVVEPAAAAFAAERRSTAQLAAMDHAVDEMARLGLGDARGRAADGRFHATLLEATGNDFLAGLAKSIVTAVEWTTALKVRAEKPPRDAIPLHRDIFAAIAARDPQAARHSTERLLALAREDTEALLDRVQN